MRGPVPAWPRPLLLVALAVAMIGCSLSLRGAGNPGGQGSTPTPFVAGGPPSVEIYSPATGTVGAVGQVIYVDVRGRDDWPVGVARLELFAGDNLVDRVLTAGGANRQSFGAILDWTPLAPGPYQVAAFAYRADGTASAPAVITMIITGTAITPGPTATLVPLETPSPIFSTPTPSPSASPTHRPTPSPTPAPIAVHIDVWVDEAEMPDWTVGQPGALVVHVQNIGSAAVPFVRIIAALAGDTGKTRTGTLVPGQETTVVISLTPQADGQRTLKVTGKLPVGYVDSDPTQNTLVWEGIVTVNPGATEPPPTASPSPSPSPSPGP